PELAHEGVRVGQARLPAGAAADVADGEQRLDRVLAEEAGQRALGRGRGVEEDPGGAALVEREAPAVGVRACLAASLTQPTEREDDVRRDVALHPKQLAHASLDHTTGGVSAGP